MTENNDSASSGGDDVDYFLGLYLDSMEWIASIRLDGANPDNRYSGVRK